MHDVRCHHYMMEWIKETDLWSSGEATPIKIVQNVQI